MRLTYKHITRNIIRCFLDEQTKVTIGPIQGETTIRYECSEFNMSTVIASRATIRTDAGSAVIEWRGSGIVKVSGDLEIAQKEGELAGEWSAVRPHEESRTQDQTRHLPAEWASERP